MWRRIGPGTREDWRSSRISKIAKTNQGPSGVPVKVGSYVMPQKAGRLALQSLVAGIVLLALGGALYAFNVFGSHDLASPGPLARPHAANRLGAGGASVACVECHQPAKGVTDLRCERCHDPVDTHRFGSPAHAALTGAAVPASHVAQVGCAVCHKEHEGLSQDLRRVDDAGCISCHAFSSFTRHPEFAAVRAQKVSDPGIRFDHSLHLQKIDKAGDQRCQSCHVTTNDRAGFAPIAFDQHCASCHLKNGALTMNGTDILPSALTPQSLRSLETQLPVPPMVTDQSGAPAAPVGGRVQLTGFRHRDPWVLAVAGRLRQTIGSPELSAERTKLTDEFLRLSAIARSVPIARVPDADLDAWIATTTREAAALDQQIAAGPSAPAQSAGALAALAGVVDPSVASLAVQVSTSPAQPNPNAARPADAADLEARRREVQQLLDAVAARSTGPLAARAADLKKRLADIKTEAGAVPSQAAIADRLDAITDALAIVQSSVSGDTVAELRGLADAVRQQMAGGLGTATGVALRVQIATLLDSAEGRAAPGLRAQIADLRMALSDAAGGDLVARRDQKRRLLDRLELERTLRASGIAATVEARANAEQSAASNALQAVRARLDATSRGAVPDVERASAALQSLMNACVKCHNVNQDKTALLPVTAGRSTLTAATFTHDPHKGQNCESCHSSITKSTYSTDLNIPAVATCQTCHNSSQAPADCATCHVYHPRSAAEMVVAAR